jgi:hypothetical protein
MSPDQMTVLRTLCLKMLGGETLTRDEGNVMEVLLKLWETRGESNEHGVPEGPGRVRGGV